MKNKDFFLISAGSSFLSWDFEGSLCGGRVKPWSPLMLCMQEKA